MSAVALDKEQDREDQILLLTFQVDTASGPIHCGLNIHKAREVIDVGSLSLLPKDYFPFVAVHDLRGIPIPIIPLDAALDPAADRSSPSKSGRIIVTELQHKIIGLQVSTTGRIRPFRNSDVLEPPSALSGVKHQFFNGVVRLGNEYLYLLDLESILDSLGVPLDGEPDEENEKAIFSGRRVLVVEDSKLYQRKIKTIFSVWGFEIFVASNGEEALQILERENYKFDLIFSDIEMPVMNGIELAARLRVTPVAAGIPLLFNSSLSNPALIDELREKNASSYLVKFDQDVIKTEITRVLQR